MDIKDTNIKVTSQFPFCPNALSMDLYRGCPHNCLYCFVQIQNNNTFKYGNHNNVIEPRNFAKIIKMIKEGNSSQRFKFCSYLLSKKQPLHIGGMADPFPFKIESNIGHTKKFLEKIGDYPCLWSTKNPMPEYSNLFSAGNHFLQFSCIGNNKLGNKIESGLPPFDIRFKNLIKLKGSVKKIIIRLQPFIPFLWDRDSLLYFFDKIHNVVDAVTVEFLKKPFNENWEKFSDVVGFNIGEKFNNLNSEGKDKVIDLKYRFDTLTFIKKICHERDIEFYSAENQFRDMGDGYNCCGISVNDGKLIQSKLDFCMNKMLFIAKEKGYFCFDDILLNMNDEVKNFTLANVSTVTVHKDRSLQDSFQEKYNSEFPIKFYRNLKKNKINNKLIYEYKQKPFGGFNFGVSNDPIYKNINKETVNE